LARRGWQLWAAVAGIAFVVLSIVSLAVAGDDTGDTDQAILSYYADDTNRHQAIASLFVFLAGMLAFLFFLAGLWARLRRAEGEPRGWSAAALASGAAFAALQTAAIATWASIPLTIEDSEEFVLDPNTERLVSTLGYALFFTGLTLTAVLVAATSALALRTGVLPRWLGWVGVVVAVAMLASFTFIPAFVLLAWVLVVSIVMLARAGAVPIEREPAPV
jgi:Domain of unknown function (DUF4386)